MCFQRAVSVVANVPEIFGKAKDCPDLVEKMDSLVLVATHPQLNGGEPSLLELMSHRFAGYGQKRARNAEDLQRKFVEKTLAGGGHGRSSLNAGRQPRSGHHLFYGTARVLKIDRP